jgi:hypothetical protein
MAYKDKEKEREAARLRKQKQRMSRPKEDVTPLVTPSIETVAELHPQDKAWAHVKEYIQSESPGMSRLERLQRIAGSLGKYSDQVYFGVNSEGLQLTMDQIGKVIGTQPALNPKPE